MSDPVGGVPCHVPLNLLRKLPSYRTPPNAVPASLRRPQPPKDSYTPDANMQSSTRRP